MDAGPKKRSYRMILFFIGIAAMLGLQLIVTAASAFIIGDIKPENFTDINPDRSDLDPTNPNGASGGRVNGLASVAGNNQVFYAASEWGGLFKTTDGGRTWFRLNRHLPVVTWDVEVDPSNTNRVYATSFYDGRVDSLAGINVSTDGGNTWTHPPSAVPPVGFCADAARRDEPSAFGISVDPDNPQNVYIGTNCGLAISNDSGGTWRYVDPTPNTPANNVWDVVVHDRGIIDICGDDRHFRSTDGGTTWTGGSTALPPGRCSITVSPDEAYVLFVAAADNNVYESDDAGMTWRNLGNPAPQGRIPFVTTNQRSDLSLVIIRIDRFDLWFGDVSLFQASCVTPAVKTPGGALRCPTSGSWTNQQTGAHNDAGDLVFDAEAANDACPMIYSNDGGVYRNTDLGTDCQSPNWEQPDKTPHALWLFGMAGVHQPGVISEDIYIGMQDNGSFANINAGRQDPLLTDWHNQDCCDVFDMAAEDDTVLYTIGFFGPPGRGFRLFLGNRGLTTSSEINTYPAGGLVTAFLVNESLETWGDDRYVVLTQDCTNTRFNGIDDDGDGQIDEADEDNGCPGGAAGSDGGVFITSNIKAAPISWIELGNATEPPSNQICEVQVAMSDGTPTFYVQAGGCDRRTSGSLWRFVGTNPAGNWQQIDTNIPGGGGVGTFGVDPNDPNRLYASTLPATGPHMVFSNDGGLTWQNDLPLDEMMTGGGVFRYQTQRGPTNFTGFGGYPQPTLVAFDPEDPNILVAGGVDSGVFVSVNGGVSWNLVTDPFTSNISGIPHLPRPYFVHFDHDVADKITLYIGTQGRGVWRISLPIVIKDQGPLAGPAKADE